MPLSTEVMRGTGLLGPRGTQGTTDPGLDAQLKTKSPFSIAGTFSIRPGVFSLKYPREKNFSRGVAQKQTPQTMSKNNFLVIKVPGNGIKGAQIRVKQQALLRSSESSHRLSFDRICRPEEHSQVWTSA